ncbi:MAG: hypothetical protein GXO42_01690 [bacterium]|nr:hypothetical protein [bacterium]
MPWGYRWRNRTCWKLLGTDAKIKIGDKEIPFVPGWRCLYWLSAMQESTESTKLKELEQKIEELEKLIKELKKTAVRQ